MTRLFTPEVFDVFDGWVDHLTNWANTDGLATWPISETVRLNPDLVGRLLQWTASGEPVEEEGGSGVAGPHRL